MKLKRENLEKITTQNGVIYKYRCNDTDFFMEVEGDAKNRTIKVYSGVQDGSQEVFTTNNSMEAWNKFEELVDACSPNQGSSGGNIQNNPEILPLIAISRSGGGELNGTLFAQTSDQKQINIFDFQINASAFPTPTPDNVFTVDWTNEEISVVLAAEIIMKKVPMVFESNPSAEVFLFIPKSLVGETPQNDENPPPPPPGHNPPPPPPPPGHNPPPPPPGHNPPPPPPGHNPPPPPPPPPPPTDDEEPPTDDEGEPTRYRSTNPNPVTPEDVDYDQIITMLASSTNRSPNVVQSMFRTVSTGETFLSTNNWQKIKTDLGLQPNMTPRQLSQQIINSK